MSYISGLEDSISFYLCLQRGNQFQILTDALQYRHRNSDNKNAILLNQAAIVFYNSYIGNISVISCLLVIVFIVLFLFKFVIKTK